MHKHIYINPSQTYIPWVKKGLQQTLTLIQSFLSFAFKESRQLMYVVCVL